MIGAPKPLKPGDELTTSWLNDLLMLARKALVNLGVNSGLAMIQNESGTFLRATGPSGQLAITDGTITASAGGTAGTGSVKLVNDSVVSGVCTLTTTAIVETVFNFSTTTGGIPTGVYVWITQSPSGNWWIVAVDCGN